MADPSPTADNGSMVPSRAPDGTFLPGNKCAKGNPHAKRVQKLRTMFIDEALKPVENETTGRMESRMQRVADAMFTLAEKGDVAAARFCAEYSIGRAKPANHEDDEGKDTFVFVLPESVSPLASDRPYTPNLSPTSGCSRPAAE